MMQIEMPNLTCQESKDGSVAKFVVEPLERGFGTTIGNAMRRVLLGGLPGAAPVAIRIQGVQASGPGHCAVGQIQSDT